MEVSRPCFQQFLAKDLLICGSSFGLAELNRLDVGEKSSLNAVRHLNPNVEMFLLLKS